MLLKCGASIISQTQSLVPADRVLYALRDRTGTVESPGLICASILSKKLAAGLDALVLDVKTGSGAFLRKQEDSEYLAALMVATAEAAGTRTVALLTDMGQPLGHAAGNWIELVESVELLRGQRPPESEDLRELSLILAGWMIHLGGQAATPEAGLRPRRSSPRRRLRTARLLRDGRGAGRRHLASSTIRSLPQARRNQGRRRLGERLHLPPWTPPPSAGPCSAPARAARKPASRSIPMPASTSMPAAARASKKASPATLYATSAALLAEPERDSQTGDSLLPNPTASSAAGQPHLHPRIGGRASAQQW